MKLSDTELDLLKELDSIPRTEEEKQQSLKNIKSRVASPMKKRPTFIRFGVVVATIMVGLIFGVFAFSGNQPEESFTAQSPYQELIKDADIQRTMIAKSKSANSFGINSQSGLMMGVVLIDKDTRWNRQMVSMLEGAREAKVEPTIEPLFDLLIMWTNTTSLKFKVYVTDETVVLRDTTNDEYYDLSKDDARSLVGSLQGIPTLQD